MLEYNLGVGRNTYTYTRGTGLCIMISESSIARADRAHVERSIPNYYKIRSQTRSSRPPPDDRLRCVDYAGNRRSLCARQMTALARIISSSSSLDRAYTHMIQYHDDRGMLIHKSCDDAV